MRSDTLLIREGKAQSPFAAVLRLALLPVILSIGFAAVLWESGIVSPDHVQSEQISTLMLFVAQDLPGALAVGAVLLGAWLLAGRTTLSARLRMSDGVARRTVAALAIAGAVAAWLTAVLVFRGYNLSLDEFMPQFQAEIFRHGRLLAPLSPKMLGLHANLQPFFAYTDTAHALWGSDYRPGHAMLLALMPQVDGVNLLNPVLTALSVWAIGNIAHRLWPERPEAPVLAAALLLMSPQVIVTAGSGFAYSAHLAFNLMWLALFLKGVFEDRTLPHIGAAILGAYSIGLHQVTFHPLFAAPFLMLLLLGTVGRRVHLLPYVVLYLVAMPIWVLWPELAVWITTGDSAVFPRHLADVDYIANYLRHRAAQPAGGGIPGSLLLSANLLRFVLWLSPAVLLFGLAALARPRRLGAIVWAAVASVVLTIVVNHLLMPNQMLTWGARYYHPVIGNMILLALAGYAGLCDAERDGLARRLVETGVLVLLASGIFLLPQRLIQVHAKVAPRAAVQQRINAIDADVVVMPDLPVWFRFDFVRNDPFLANRPLIISVPPGVPIPRPDQLPGPVNGGRIHVLTMQDLAAFGLPRGTLYEPGAPIPNR